MQTKRGMKTDKNWEEISIREIKRLLSTNPAPLSLICWPSFPQCVNGQSLKYEIPALLSARFHFRAIFGEAAFAGY